MIYLYDTNNCSVQLQGIKQITQNLKLKVGGSWFPKSNFSLIFYFPTTPCNENKAYVYLKSIPVEIKGSRVRERRYGL